MRKNIEIKAYCDDPAGFRATCEELGANFKGEGTEEDTYFDSNKGRLKLRKGALDSALIYYDRLSTPALRESSFARLPFSPDASNPREVLTEALGIRQVVSKTRQAWEYGAVRIHLDNVEGLGHFISIEVEVDAAGNGEKATEVAQDLVRHFGIAPHTILPWSYADLQAMHAAATCWREELARVKTPGTLFLLDGPSCTGKTTLMQSLLDDASLDLHFVPRFCTRDRRKGEKTEHEYVFVGMDEFIDRAGAGAFIEYRDYEFDMSYGLPWDRTMELLLNGKNALALINLGNVYHAKRVLPEAVAILIHASLDTIRQRLIARGMNKPDQIEERLQNAQTVESYKEFYDDIVENEDGGLEQARVHLREAVESHLAT